MKKSKVQITLILLCAIMFFFADSALSEAENASKPQSYRIGVEDVLTINVWKEPDISRDVWVRPDGRITIPLVGEVFAEGITTSELTEILTKKLKDYFTDPIVTVTLMETNSYTVYLLGRVKTPGFMRLRSPKTFLQVISMAGGFEEFADTDSIAIMRREGDKSVKIQVDFDKMLSRKGGDSDLMLQRGDVVIIP